MSTANRPSQRLPPSHVADEVLREIPLNRLPYQPTKLQNNWLHFQNEPVHLKVPVHNVRKNGQLFQASKNIRLPAEFRNQLKGSGL
jgi:hypothetical protein